MTRTDLSNAATTMYADGSELVIERVFGAGPQVIWAMLTTPEHVAQWWGPHGTTTEVVEMDVRAGGRWRWINRYPGGEAPFTGEYLEVRPGERLVRTSVFDVAPGNLGPGALETVTLEVAGAGTKLVYHTRFPSEDVLAYALGQGMTKGALEQFDRLAGLLPA